MGRLNTSSNILMELRKIAQHPYLGEPELENRTLPEKEQHRRLIEASGKLKFLKQLLPELKERGFRVLLFSQFKMVLDIVEDFLYGEQYRYLRLDGDVAQVNRQKDMDKFNAPGSDVFIFLLTTRAGGVGINLATADAVIMFDPDFNPHQDLQAISRAHRFGQKKRVLVFRLMAENSVESRIINNGKRKMVLDHLVVQQMGKETEEGEVDNLILFGAEELTKANPEDTSADRVWTKELIHELIDGAEKEAEEQAKDQEARDAAEAAAGTASDDGASRDADNDAAKRGGFSFARIWETKIQKESATPDEEEEEPEPFADDDAWAKFLEDAEKENREREVLIVEGNRTRKVRQLPAVSYKYQLDIALDDDLSDADSKSSKRRGKKDKRKDKGKSKAVDEDFVAAANASDDSDGEDILFDAVPENLLELSNEDSGVRHTTLAENKLTKAERHALKRRLLAQAQRAGVATAAATGTDASPLPGAPIVPQLPQLVSPTAGPSRLPLPTTNAAAGPSHAVPASLTHNPSTSVPSSGPIYRPTNPGMVVSQPQAPPHAGPSHGNAPAHGVHQGAIHAAKISAARDVFMRLRDVLMQLNNDLMKQMWKDIVNPDTSDIEERLRLYLYVAVSVDDLLESKGKQKYFTMPGNLEVVKYYISLGKGIAKMVVTGPPSTTDRAALQQEERYRAELQASQASQRDEARRYAEGLQAQQVYVAQQAQAQAQAQQAHAEQVRQQLRAQQAQASQFIAQQAQAHLQAAQAQAQQQAQRVYLQSAQPGPSVVTYAMPQQQPNGPTQRMQQLAANVAPMMPHPQGAPLVANGFPHQQSPPIVHPTPQRPPQIPQVLRHENTPARAPQQSPTARSASGQRTPSHAYVASPSIIADSPSVTITSRPTISLSTTSSASPAVRPDAAQPNAMQLGDSSRIGPPAAPEPSNDPNAHPTCFWCQGEHYLRHCPGLIDEAGLNAFEKSIENESMDEDEKESGRNAIAQMRMAHRQNAVEASAKKKKAKNATRERKKSGGGPGGGPPGGGPGGGGPSGGGGGGASSTANGTNGTASHGVHANGLVANLSANGALQASRGAHADDAIFIDDGEGDEPPTKRQRTVPPGPAPELASAPTPPRPQSRATGDSDRSTFQGCQICNNPVGHVVKACPVVQAGPDSIAEALKRFTPDDYLYSVLSMMYMSLKTGTAPSKLARCAFCGGACNRTVRECVEARGSRKQLKAKIRELEGPMRDAEAKIKQLKGQQTALLAAGIRTNSEQESFQNLVRDINKIDLEVEQDMKPTLAPLYEAYLSWPNPNSK